MKNDKGATQIMNKQTIIKNILTIYSKYGVTQEDIEPLIDESVEEGRSYDSIYFFLQLAITDVCGLDFFWCTSRQMGRALGRTDEEMLEIMKQAEGEYVKEEDLDKPFRVPVEVGEKFFIDKGETSQWTDKQ